MRGDHFGSAPLLADRSSHATRQLRRGRERAFLRGERVASPWLTGAHGGTRCRAGTQRGDRLRRGVRVAEPAVARVGLWRACRATSVQVGPGGHTRKGHTNGFCLRRSAACLSIPPCGCAACACVDQLLSLCLWDLSATGLALVVSEPEASVASLCDHLVLEILHRVVYVEHLVHDRRLHPVLAQKASHRA